MPFINVGDTELYYEQSGSGPRLLIISPSNTSLNEMKPYFFQAPKFKLASEFNCLFYDHRGMGKSGTPNISWPEPSMQVLASDALALIDAIGWTSCHVLGLSFGGSAP